MPAHRALHALSAAALVFAAACTDATSVAPPAAPGPDGPAAVRLACTADVAARTVQCAAPGATGNLRADRIYGQGAAMKLTSSNVAIVADSFTFDMTVTNLLEYPVGTTDGVNADPNGIRVFFVDGIHTTQGSGSVTVANADGVDVFTASGQAYFRYLGVLQPNATTAAKKWKLRFDPGVEHFSFGLYISTPVPPGGGYVALTIQNPRNGNVFTDTVDITVRIDSASASIQSVKAFVEDRSVTLHPIIAGVMGGKLSLAGLAYGSHQLRVHGVTVRADTGNAYVTITKDAPPTLTVTLPTTNQVARPNLRIDADCVDDNPAGCASITAYAQGQVIASGTSGIHADVSLAAFNETQQEIYFQAKDSRNRLRTFTVPVYVQTNPALTFADSAGTMALDVDSARLLFGDIVNTVWIRDRTGGARTALQASSYGNLSGRLHPLGAIFGREANGRLYDYRNGTVVDAAANVPGGLTVKGTWAAWPTTSGVGRRDLLAGTSEGIGNGVHPDIGPNGDLVYDYGGKIYRYRTFPVSEMVDSGGASRPVTDGTNIVYLKGGVTLFDGTSRTVLTTNPAGSTPHTYWEVNAGWIAYAVADGAGAAQLRVRAPDGTDRQVTSTVASNLIRALSAEGTLVFARSGSLYVLRAPYTATPTRIGKDWFTVRFRSTELQLYLGNSVFTATY
jgi:hypothetical protein